MKEINVREMRASIGRLAELVEAEGELVISRRGQPIAWVLPIEQRRQAPSHADLRERMARLQTTSAELLRAERDAH
ncbi:MAG: type II toxin-antitoxin system Phd/YefM family antitoxin [Cyanobacteriota bacterium]